MMKRMLLAACCVLGVILPIEAGIKRYFQPYGASGIVLYPESDGTITGWTHTNAAWYTEIDDPTDAAFLNDATVDESTYITCPKPGPCAATFGMTSSSAYSGKTIVYVAFGLRSQKVNGSGAKAPVLNIGVLIGATRYQVQQVATASPAASSYTLISSIAVVNPATGVAWTPTEIDDLQIYIDVTATDRLWDGKVSNLYAIVVYEDPLDTTNRERSGGGD